MCDLVVVDGFGVGVRLLLLVTVMRLGVAVGIDGVLRRVLVFWRELVGVKSIEGVCVALLPVFVMERAVVPVRDALRDFVDAVAVDVAEMT